MEKTEVNQEEGQMVFKLKLEPTPSSNEDQKQQNDQNAQSDHNPQTPKKCSPDPVPEREPETETEEKYSSDTVSASVPVREENIPLAVPMMAANTTHSSVTRNDAKKITQSRLKKLRALCQKADDTLSKPQKMEKKRIIRLEKNRRAAAMSRRKKKMYVKNLEENSKLMARHIAILEMENAHLRAFLNMPPQGPSMGGAMRPGFPAMNPNMMYNRPQFQTNQMSQFMPPSVNQSANVYTHGQTPNGGTMPNGNGMTQSSSTTNSLEPTNSCTISTGSHGSSGSPPLKKRKLNDLMDTETAQEMEDKKCLMATGVPNGVNPVPLPVGPVNPMQRMMMMPPNGLPAIPGVPAPNMGNMVNPTYGHARMGGLPPNGYGLAPPPSMLMQNGCNNTNGTLTAPQSIPPQQHQHQGVTTLPEIGKLECLVSDRDSLDKKNTVNFDGMTMDKRASFQSDEYERKSLETDDETPPEVYLPDNDFGDLSLLEHNEDNISVIEGTVDEYGSVLDFSTSSVIKSDRVYL